MKKKKKGERTLCNSKELGLVKREVWYCPDSWRQLLDIQKFPSNRSVSVFHSELSGPQLIVYVNEMTQVGASHTR